MNEAKVFSNAVEQTSMDIVISRLSNVATSLDDQASIFGDQLSKLDANRYKSEIDVSTKNPVPRSDQPESIVDQTFSLLEKLERIHVRICTSNDAFRKIV
jgi:hypothetical protein